MVHDVATGESKRRGVRAVARRRDWWGTEPGLSEVVETSFNQCESPALRSLRALDKDWALTAESRALLAQFIAIHVVRTPAFGTFVRGTTEAAIDDFRDRGTIAPESFDGAADLFRRPRMHANTLLGQITRIASLFCSMQWVLVRFNEDLHAARSASERGSSSADWLGRHCGDPLPAGPENPPAHDLE
jgi:hypothetical protein